MYRVSPPLQFMRRKAQKSISPFNTDGNFETSFEKLVSDIQQKMPFKIEDQHYDRTPQAHAAAKELARQSDPTQKDNLAPIGTRAAFERIYNKEVLRTTSLPQEFYYGSAPTRREVVEWRQRWATYGLAAAGVGMAGYGIYYAVGPAWADPYPDNVVTRDDPTS